jgi:hypothetical protein
LTSQAFRAKDNRVVYALFGHRYGAEMAELQHSQIKAKLIEGAVGLIDMTDVGAQAAEELERHALSRAIAATALCMTSDIEIKQAVAALVDGGRDNGIDAIYYDSQSRACGRNP